MQDVPPVSRAPDLAITQPRIYYGLLGTNYMLVDTKTPSSTIPGPAARLPSYTGSGGIPIGSFLNRLAFSVRFGTIQFFTTTAIDSQSRIIIRDNIVARLHDGGAVPHLRSATPTW